MVAAPWNTSPSPLEIMTSTSPLGGGPSQVCKECGHRLREGKGGKQDVCSMKGTLKGSWVWRFAEGAPQSMLEQQLRWQEGGLGALSLAKRQDSECCRCDSPSS